MLEFIVFLFMMIPITLAGFIMFFVFCREAKGGDFTLYLLLGCYLMVLIGITIFVISMIVGFLF